jgi:hypothetical protein
MSLELAERRAYVRLAAERVVEENQVVESLRDRIGARP